MHNSKVPVSTAVAVWALLIISILAGSVARANDLGITDESYPLGFDYRPPQAAKTGTDLYPGRFDQRMPVLHPVDLTYEKKPPAGIQVIRSQENNIARDAGVQMKTAFKTLQGIKRNEDTLAHGQVKRLPLFDSGKNAPSHQVGIDFLADQIDNENHEMPETLAMLLLGTVLIGLARIQRRHMKD